MFQRTAIFAFFALALPLTAHAFAEDEQPQKSDTLALQKLTEKIGALEWNNATLEKVLTDPETWAVMQDVAWVNAGPDAQGVMRCYNGRLVVNAPLATQAKVFLFLDALRKK